MWSPAPRTESACAALAAAEADRAARPERYRLEPDHIAAIAARQPDDERRFAHGWREGLEQYLGAAREDGRLNALGVGMAARTAIGRLRAGATMSRFREADPGRAFACAHREPRSRPGHEPRCQHRSHRAARRLGTRGP